MSTTFNSSACRPVYAPGKTRRPGFLGWLLTLNAIWRERRALAAMEAHRLKDLGLSRDAAEIEAKRTAWDAPDRWLQ